ncbi:hypothetical protein TRVA0_007S00408 [Trichomonascus vanleenenianus]|uniref:uncharacterized protein n=1 Tax=Trichomonascus vanleenenianus TaxID=2268995 RepID=UPI003ECB564F
MASFEEYYNSLVTSDPWVGLPLTKDESRKFCVDWMPLLVRLYVKHFGQSVVSVDRIVDSAEYQSDLAVLVNLFKVEERAKGQADLSIAYRTISSIMPKHVQNIPKRFISSTSSDSIPPMRRLDTNIEPPKRSSSSSVYCSPCADSTITPPPSSSYDRSYPDSTTTTSSAQSYYSQSYQSRYESIDQTIVERPLSPQPLSDTATLLGSTDSSSMGSDTLESEIVYNYEETHHSTTPLSIGFASENELFHFDTSDAVGNSLVGWTKTKMAQPAKINGKQKLRTMLRI